MRYVYILRSEKTGQYYYGQTNNLPARLEDHNNGQTKSTKSARPWRVAWYCAFVYANQAESFEKYLKTASGKAFAKKRLLP